MFASRAAQQTNELVKVLTYLTAVVGICAAVAGVFGMNFETGFFATGDAGLASPEGAVRSGRLMRAEKIIVGNFEVQ